MNKEVSKVLFFLLTVFCLSFVFYPMSSDAATYINENGDIIHRDFVNRNTNPSASYLKALSTSQSVGQISSTTSYAWPDVFSNQATKIPFLSFYLYNDNDQSVTGIAVDEIKIYQQKTLILSSANITSYIQSGEYYINNAALQSQFKNPNGDNSVDVVFYKNGIEVARMANFTLKCYANVIVSNVFPTEVGIVRSEFPLDVTILNANDSAVIGAYYTDSNGNTVATLAAENSEMRDYDSDTKELNTSLKMKKGALFNNSESSCYEAHILVNGNEIPYCEDYYNQLYVCEGPQIFMTTWMNEPTYYYHVEGINLTNAGPFKLVLKQNGVVISTIENIYAQFDEDTYWEYIKKDITSEIADQNTELQTTLYCDGEIIHSFTFLRKQDTADDASSVSTIAVKNGSASIIKAIDNNHAGTEVDPRAIIVANGTTVAGMTGAIEATDKSNQTYYVFANLADLHNYRFKDYTSTLVTGDILGVVAEDGVSQAGYVITVETISVVVKGQVVTFNVPPVIVNGEILVPLRAIFERMGATVTWDESIKTATGVKGDIVVVMAIGSTSPTVNGVIVNINVPAQIINGTTMVPLRFVCEAFGGIVEWNASTSTINVTLPSGGGGGGSSIRVVNVNTDSSNVNVNNTPLKIIVPADVTNSTLTTSPANGVATLPLVIVQSSTSLGIVDVSIPSGTQVTGPSNWDGSISLPKVKENNSVTVPDNGNTPIVSAVIEIGLSDTSLTFSQPVRILLSGQGGKKAGWVMNANFTPITYQMIADSAAALGSNTDGYLAVGNDLVIWTKHFTTFVAYAVTETDECFIATAAYGSKFDWPVTLLRAFRDQYLLTNPWGQAFVSFYYQNSPPIAAFIAQSEPLKALVRTLLAPIIAVVYMLYHPAAMAIFLLLAAITGYIIRSRRKIKTV